MKKGKPFGEILFGKKEHKRQMKRVKEDERQEMRSPNTVKIYYPDGVTMTMGYENISDLFEGLKKEVESLYRKLGDRKPLPTKIIIKIDRRLR